MLRLLYRGSRRLGVLDIQSVMRGHSRSILDSTAASRSNPIPSAWHLRMVSPNEALAHCETAEMRQRVGQCDDAISDQRQVAILLDETGQLRGFTWIATEQVLASENFARSPNLGWPIDLSGDEAYLFNAWTDPDCRGRGLFPAIVIHAARTMHKKKIWIATADWTNQSSRRSFEKLGFESLGHAKHFKLGPMSRLSEPLSDLSEPSLPGGRFE